MKFVSLSIIVYKRICGHSKAFRVYFTRKCD